MAWMMTSVRLGETRCALHHVSSSSLSSSGSLIDVIFVLMPSVKHESYIWRKVIHVNNVIHVLTLNTQSGYLVFK